MSFPQPNDFGSSSFNYESAFQTALPPALLRPSGADGAAPGTHLDRPQLLSTGSSSSGGGGSFITGSHDAPVASSSSSTQRPAVGSRGQPLTAPVKRGSACLRCRKHKLKCDAVKPHCSACVKHHGLQLTADPNGPAASAGPDCSWDPEKPPKRTSAAKRQRDAGGVGENVATGSSSSAGASARKTKRRAVAAASEDPSAGESSDSADGGHEEPALPRASPSDGGINADHVRALEKKVRHMEALLGSLGARPLADIASSAAGLSRPPSLSESVPYVPGPASQAYHHSPFQRGPLPSAAKAHKVAAAAGTGGPYDQAGPPVFTPSGFCDLPSPLDQPAGSGGSQQRDKSTFQRAPSPAFDSFGPSTDMLPSSYPARLPPPRLLLSLIETFFARVPLAPGMLHKASFMRDLQRGPDDRLFPHVAILHVRLDRLEDAAVVLPLIGTASSLPQAICALTARYSGVTSAHEPPASASFAPPPPSAPASDNSSAHAHRWGLADPLDKESFGARHAIWAKEEIESGIACAERLFEVTLGAWPVACCPPRAIQRS
jgi:hypothetical protein